jgi:hypothetical protein
MLLVSIYLTKEFKDIYLSHITIMNESKLNTYSHGFTLKSIKDISKKEFVELCNNLEYKFNNYYNKNEYSFSPECITEGGIVFNNFNNKDNYKSMRIYFLDKNSGMRSLYGTIEPNIKEEWIKDESILINNNAIIGTFLKSFYNAPKWTFDELKIFKECFENIGLYIETLPTRKELKGLKKSSYYINLFTPLKV